MRITGGILNAKWLLDDVSGLVQTSYIASDADTAESHGGSVVHCTGCPQTGRRRWCSPEVRALTLSPELRGCL